MGSCCCEADTAGPNGIVGLTQCRCCAVSAIGECWAAPSAGLQPVLVHLSKNKQGTYSFHPVSVNFMVEVTKTAFALVTLLLLVSSLGRKAVRPISTEGAGGRV